MRTTVKILALLLIAVLVAPIFQSCAEPMGNMTVEILSTGDSDCILIYTGDHTVILDTAEGNDYKQIYARLTELGVTRIDAMILSHYDSDHVGCAAEIVRDFSVGAVYGPNYVRTSSEMREFNESIADSGTPFTKLQSDTSLQYGDLIFKIDIPKEKRYKDENDYSLIVTLSYGMTGFIFLGDSEKTRMTEFNASSVGAQFDVVKLPHHGDYFKALKTFAQFNQFRYAVSCVISETDVDDRLSELISMSGAEDIRTYDGAAVFVSNGVNVELERR